MPGTRGMKELWCHSLGTKVRKACPKYTGAVAFGDEMATGIEPSPSPRSGTGRGH